MSSEIESVGESNSSADIVITSENTWQNAKDTCWSVDGTLVFPSEPKDQLYWTGFSQIETFYNELGMRFSTLDTIAVLFLPPA